MGSSGKIDKIILIQATEDRKHSWEYDPETDQVQYFSKNRLSDSFLKGIHDFVDDLNAGESYQLQVEKFQIFGRTIQKESAPYCYLIVIFNQSSTKKSKIKKLEKRVKIMVKIFSRKIKNADISLFENPDPINLKDLVHKLIQA